MKISTPNKTENRRKIVRAAVDLITQKNFKAVTMKEIARHAGIGEATIGKYFPDKKSILGAYYEDHLESCIASIQTIDDFWEYSLQEQIQTLFETSLDLYLDDRKFVKSSFTTIFFSLKPSFPQAAIIRKRFIAVVDDMIQAAVATGEIPDQAFHDVFHRLFWEHYLGMVIYWLNDNSEQFTNTSVLIDKSLDLACSFLKSNLLGKCLDIAVFLFRQHILSRMEPLTERLSTLYDFKQDVIAEKNGKRHPRK